MTKEKCKVIIFVALVVTVVFGIIFSNIPMVSIRLILPLVSIVFIGLGKILFKGDQKPRPEPTKENILRASLAGYGGLSALGVVLGIGIGFHILCNFEKNGSQPSIFWLYAILIGFPTVGIIFYLNKRSRIIKSMSNMPTTPDKRVSG